VPVLVEVIAGEAPLRAKEVALAHVSVTFRKFIVPVAAPIVSVVAAPPMLRVVAVAFTKSNDVDGVVIDVVISGEVIDWIPVNV